MTDMKEALEAIAAFPDETLMYEYLERSGISVDKLLPPYITMARTALAALGKLE